MMNEKLSILRATLAHLDLVAPLFDACRQFCGGGPHPETACTFPRDRLERLSDQSSEPGASKWGYGGVKGA
jgi:hypothetical protein